MMRLIHRSFLSLAIFPMLFSLAGAQDATYTVQFKASSTREMAEEEVRQLKTKNISAYITKGVVPNKGVVYRVRSGVFTNRNEANRFGANLRQRGLITEFIVMPYEKPIDDFTSNSTSTNPPQTSGPARINQSSFNSQAFTSARERSESASLKKGTASAPAAASGAAIVTRSDSPAPANNFELGASAEKTSTSTPPRGFARFLDPKAGYSVDYPDYWTGQALSEKEAKDQRMSAGATFISEKDGVFLNVIWNELDKTNNTGDDNDSVVNAVLSGISTSDGVSRLEETARRVENRDGLIKTYLNLKASVQLQGQGVPLDYLAKAVIIRASRGVLLVATFYAKDSAPNVAGAVDRVIASARAPK
ncbi:MAG: SPOR domain-containing protein [Chloracidobacterium sp.]|nr:SPOR domain-containing protein [Chloracidobacterium sp.]